MTKQEEKKELPDVNGFYVNTALYTEFEITNIEKNAVFKIVFNKTPIDCFCIDCSANSVFKPIDNVPHKPHGSQMSLPISSPSEWNIMFETTRTNIQKEYVCSRNEKHRLIFFIQIKNGKISKIGQSPALADIAEQEIKKYRKILGDKNYNEFSKSIGLFAHGVGVGSFVYLRRIIENFIIKPSYEEAKTNPKWNDEKYQKSRVKEKIEMLKASLPEFLVQNSIIYSIISKGIHELTENECKEYYPALKTCLEFVLTDLEAKRETEQKRKDMQSMLGQIAGKINK